MTGTILTISGPNHNRRVPLDSERTVIGRNPDCGVVIDSRQVSRRHAEIFRTPANGWVIKDLGSSNGTFVNGRRIESCAITADDLMQIGPVTLTLGERVEPRTVLTPVPQPPKILMEDFGTEVFYNRPRIEECTTPPYPQGLADVRRRLSELADLSAVYSEVCRALAPGPSTAAVIFGALPGGGPLPENPAVVAYHLGCSGEDTRAPAGHRTGPFHRGLRVSRRLLEAVRTNAQPLMTKSIFSCDTAITVSLIDEYSPRALMCAPIGLPKDGIDLLYVDVPIDDRLAYGPEEMFAFVQAVAQQATARASTGAGDMGEKVTDPRA